MTELLPHGRSAPARGRPRSRPYVVKLGDLERPDRPAGNFRSVAYGRGLIPGVATHVLGTFCVDTSDRVFAITYDDGPHPEHTPRILDTLARLGATATFFVLAGPARAHPGIVRRILDEGHEIALHGRDHRSLLEMSDREAIAMIRESRATVEDVAGRRVRLYRPPYGAHTPRQALLVRALGLDLVIWSGDAVDWLHDTEEAISERALAGVFPGSIILLHDDRADPELLAVDQQLPSFDRADVLERLLAETRRQGFSELTAGELIARYRGVKSLARGRMGRA